MAVTSAPIALANITAIWPGPPIPTMPILSPGLMLNRLSGPQVSVPEHRRGAVLVRSIPFFNDAKVSVRHQRHRTGHPRRTKAILSGSVVLAGVTRLPFEICLRSFRRAPETKSNGHRLLSPGSTNSCRSRIEIGRQLSSTSPPQCLHPES